MLYIKRNSNNKIVVTVSEHKTLTSPNYLFSFEHIMSKEKVRFFPKNISTTVGRYDEFEFNEGYEPDGYTGDVPFEVFPYPGQYYYSVYECFTTGSTDPKYAFDKLEEGRAEVEDETIPSPYETFISSNEDNDNFIYYGEGTNDERTLVSYGFDLTNTETGSYNWSVAYPSTYYKDLGTGVIREFDNNLYNQTGCESTYLQVSGDTFFIEITTGATWSGFKLYYDQDDVISKGYNYTDGGYSGVTFNNFRPSFVPDRWFVDVTEHNIDGSTSTSSTLWSKDTNTPLNRVISQVTGNTICTVSPTPSPTPSVTVTPSTTVTPTPSITTTPTPTPSPSPIVNGITTFSVEVDSAFISSGLTIDYRWTDPNTTTGTGTTSANTSAFSRLWVYDTITFPTPPTTPGDIYTLELLNIPFSYTEAQTWTNTNGPVDKITLEIVSYDSILEEGVMYVRYYYEGVEIESDPTATFKYPNTGSSYEWSPSANWSKDAWGYFAVVPAEHILTEGGDGILTEGSDNIDQE